MHSSFISESILQFTQCFCAPFALILISLHAWAIAFVNYIFAFMLSLDALCVLRPGSNIGQRIKPITDVLMIIYLKGKSSLVVDMCSPRLNVLVFMSTEPSFKRGCYLSV